VIAIRDSNAQTTARTWSTEHLRCEHGETPHVPRPGRRARSPHPDRLGVLVVHLFEYLLIFV
jgi:hypothetical protein